MMGTNILLTLDSRHTELPVWVQIMLVVAASPMAIAYGYGIWGWVKKII